MAKLSPVSPKDPIARFKELFEEAKAVIPTDPNAMVLATVGADGLPSARVVLLKDFDERGFVFYTNQHSRKGKDLLAHPHAALVFYWPPLQRQVRVEGSVEVVSNAEADAYFASRARLSQAGAWASQQSRPLLDRRELERAVEEVEHRYQDAPIPRPAHWGGYRLVPTAIEFWAGRPNRLHDRELYTKSPTGWTVQRLFP
jgi:pyridoxamine 5'-phosphate oxidase